MRNTSEQNDVVGEERVLQEKKSVNIFVADVMNKATKTSKKGIEVATQVLSQTASGGKSLAVGIAKGAKDLSEKAQIDSYNRKMKKYNPLFLEEYNSAEFFLPNIITIVDDAVRRDIDVCKGAIGWRENKKGTEVLFLYDEFVNQCGLKFLPNAVCDEIYYVDPFDRTCFVKIDYIFQRAHEEKIAELEHIAYSLGAKKCVIEIEEKQVTHDKKKRNMDTKEDKSKVLASETYEAEASSDSMQKRSGKSTTQFLGNNQISVPTLKWFANDNNILNLIDYRCKGGNEIKIKTLALSGSSATTMSRKAAYSIDAAVADMGISNTYSMEDKSVKESEMVILYHLEF